MNKVAIDEGAAACRDGKLSSENPYRQGTDERFGWLLGWVGARPRPVNLADKWAGAIGIAVVPGTSAPVVTIEGGLAEPVPNTGFDDCEGREDQPV